MGNPDGLIRSLAGIEGCPYIGLRGKHTTILYLQWNADNSYHQAGRRKLAREIARWRNRG